LFATSTWAATREEVLQNFYAGWIWQSVRGAISLIHSFIQPAAVI
jgi:hypothetical protein